MASINIRRDVTDPFYRYKMERLQSKIEGKGNGIKTVIVNLSMVAQQLARPASYVIKYFGFELGAQTNNNPSDDRWIINGAHEATKLQDYLDGFISKFVLCKKCKNPETDINIKDGRILLDCKACGQRSDVDLRLKLSSFILKNQPKKGKKDKSTKKADRRARKANGQDEQNAGSGSTGDSASDHADENGDHELEAGSDDELTRRINAEAKEIDAVEPKEVQWSVDTSDAAVKARANDLPDDLKRALVVDDGAGAGDEPSAYDVLGNWIQDQVKQVGNVGEVNDVEIYLKAKELGIETRSRTLTVLAQTVFDKNIVRQIAARKAMLNKMITSEKHQKAFLGGLERFIGNGNPDLINYVSPILMAVYQEDIIPEETLKEWGSKASKKYVELATSKKVRKSAAEFLNWLETASSDEEPDDE